MDSNIIEKALSEYANINGMDENTLGGVKAKLPSIKAKVELLTENQISEIKKEIGEEKIKELEQILKSVR